MAKTKTKSMLIHDLRTNGGTQPRAGIDPQVVAEYAEAMDENGAGQFPPVVVFYDGKTHWLADGFHRVEAQRKRGERWIRVDVRTGTRRDAVLFACGANADHGLRRTNEDKRRAVITLLNDEEWGKWSDREIARRCNVDHKTVASMRGSVTGEIPSERTYTTRQGTVATMDTANIGRPPANDDDARAAQSDAGDRRAAAMEQAAARRAEIAASQPPATNPIFNLGAALGPIPSDANYDERETAPVRPSVHVFDVKCRTCGVNLFLHSLVEGNHDDGRLIADASCPQCDGLWRYFKSPAQPEWESGIVLRHPIGSPYRKEPAETAPDLSPHVDSQSPEVEIVGTRKVIRGDARHLEIEQFAGPYGVIIADPPWPYDNPKDHNPRLGGYTYEPMMLAEIMEMPVEELAAKDCILFLWGTWPKLPDVVDVMTTWGFEHITGFPWIKTNGDGETPRYGPGHWVAGCSEYVLIGRKGHVSPPDATNYLGLIGPALGHSRKPDDVHDLAEQLSGPYLELFARRSRPGWSVFGNEIED